MHGDGQRREKKLILTFMTMQQSSRWGPYVTMGKAGSRWHAPPRVSGEALEVIVGLGLRAGRGLPPKMSNIAAGGAP